MAGWNSPGVITHSIFMWTRNKVVSGGWNISGVRDILPPCEQALNMVKFEVCSEGDNVPEITFSGVVRFISRHGMGTRTSSLFSLRGCIWHCSLWILLRKIAIYLLGRRFYLRGFFSLLKLTWRDAFQESVLYRHCERRRPRFVTPFHSGWWCNASSTKVQRTHFLITNAILLQSYENNVPPDTK